MRFAYILSQFPEIHETFILREILELERRGNDVLIFSLKSCKDRIIHPEAERLMRKTHYSAFLFSASLLWSQVRFLARRPVLYVRVLILLILRSASSLPVLAKSMAVFPKSVHFARLIEDAQIRHIHSHWATVPTTSALVISSLLGIPFSFTAHAWDIYAGDHMLKRKVERARFVVTCTKHNRRHILDLCGSHVSDKVFVNYHGLALDRFRLVEPPRNESLCILSIGRLVETKGFPWLMKACKRIVDLGIPVKCTIVGNGEMGSDLRSLVRAYNLDDAITFLGTVSQQRIVELFAASDVFVLPCVIAENGDRDGIPNVLIEAMASGVPVISTTVSGIPELVHNEESGLLVQPKDEAALADAILRLHKDQRLRRRLVHEARETVKHSFDVEKNVAELIGIFERHVPATTSS